MAKNAKRWPNMAKNAKKRPKIDENGPKSPKIVELLPNIWQKEPKTAKINQKWPKLSVLKKISHAANKSESRDQLRDQMIINGSSPRQASGEGGLTELTANDSESLTKASGDQSVNYCQGRIWSLELVEDYPENEIFMALSKRSSKGKPTPKLTKN